MTRGELTLVGTQAVRLVQVFHPHHTLLVERRSVGRGVEVEVSTENFIRPFTGEDHLDADRLDLSGQETHRNGRTDGRDVVRFQVVDDFVDRVEAFFERERELVVRRAEVVGRLSSRQEIGRAGETDSERVQLRPCGQRCFGGCEVGLASMSHTAHPSWTHHPSIPASCTPSRHSPAP